MFISINNYYIKIYHFDQTAYTYWQIKYYRHNYIWEISIILIILSIYVITHIFTNTDRLVLEHF